MSPFDIRLAPYVWSVENKKSIKGPVDGPCERTPWFVIYAFNSMSQLYPITDYSKLKRGEREYQAFKDELRRVDPAAFTDTHPSPSHPSPTHP